MTLRTSGTDRVDQVVVEYARSDGKPLTAADFDQLEALLTRYRRPRTRPPGTPDPDTRVPGETGP